MIVVTATIEMSADNIAKSKDLVATVVEKSRAEDGCIDYAWTVDMNNPTVIRVIEKWENLEAFSAHLQAPHEHEFKQAMADFPPISAEGSFYEATEPEMPQEMRAMLAGE